MAEKKKPFKGYNKKKHSRTGGLNDKERARINREEGSNLQRPVTGKVKAGSKAANRRKSFCARMEANRGPTSKDGQLTPKGAALKRWKCRKSLQKSGIPPKAKLAAFLREHIDNKLALKAAEPTITKSDELEKAISHEQQKENIRKQRELQNKQVVSELKGKPHRGSSVPPPIPLFIPTKDSPGVPIYLKTHPDHDNLTNGNHVNFGEASLDEVFDAPAIAHVLHQAKSRGMSFGAPIYVGINKIKESKNSELVSAPTSSKSSHLRVVKSLNADKTGMSALMKALKDCACKKSEKLLGGKGDTKDISDFDAKEVEMGLKVEMEHTKDREVAQEIVADHLSEDPSYYSKLKGSGLPDELEKAISPEQQKENIRKQRELRNKQVIQGLKGKGTDSFIPSPKLLVSKEDSLYNIPIYLKTHPNHDNLVGKHLHFDEISHNNVLEQPEVQNALDEAESRGESPITKIYVSADKVNEPSKPSSHLRVVKSLEKSGRCWEGYEPTPGKKPYSKGSCRKIKKLQKNDNEEYDFNSLEELKNHLNEHYPLKIDEDLVSDYAAELNNDYFDPYSDDVVKYRRKYTVHPSVDNDEFEETYLNHFAILDQMHRQAGEKLKEDWENQEQKEWEEYQDKYENWADNILKTIHNHCGKDNYSVNEAKTTNSKYISGTKGEDGPEFLIRLGDHPPKDEFDNEFNDKSKKTLSLLFPEHTFMRSKDHQEWNKDFNRAQQKRLSFSYKHKIGDHTDVHDFLSNLENPVQKSIKQKLIKALFIQKLQKSISAEAIETGQYQGEKLDSHHHNRLGNEYKGMAQKAHKMGDKKKAREFHDKALYHFKMADKMGFQEEEPLEKKISGKVAAGVTALSGFMSTPTATTANKPPQIESPKPIPKEKYPDLGSTENITNLSQLNTSKPLHMFLWNIAQLESTGGENTDHAIITDPDSPHYGTKAIGNFALMPNTIKEFVNRYRLDGGTDPRILKIAKMNARAGEINKYIEQNPDIEFKVAGNAAKHVIQKFGYTPQAAYAWKYGHNKTPESVKSPEEQAKMKAASYVSEFKQLMEGGSPKNLTPAIKISKPDVK
jgi:Domain of unknown function (DUF6321)/Protein of unknown function (DUF5661)